MNLIENYSEDINALCQKHKVKSLYAFGSILTEKFHDESDVDFLVEFLQLEVLEYGDNYFDLKFSLEEILKRKIDLLEEKALKNPYFIKSISQHKKKIYG